MSQPELMNLSKIMCKCKYKLTYLFELILRFNMTIL